MSQLLDPNWNRATFLPYARNKQTGEGSWAVPGIVADLLSAVMLPGDVYQGNVLLNDPATGHTSDEVIRRSADLAGAMTLGAGAIPAEANSLRSGIKAYHGSPRRDIEKFKTRNERWGWVEPAFFAVDEGTPRAEQFAKGFMPDDGSGALYQVEISGEMLDARKPEDLAKIRAALDEHTASGSHHYLEGNKGFQNSGLPGWGDDMLYHALDKAGHKGVILNERPDVRSVAVFDPELIKIVRKYGLAGAVAAGVITQQQAQQMQEQGLI